MIRTIWVVLNVLIATLPLSLAVIIASLLRVRSTRFYDSIPRFWARWLLRVSGVKVHACGLDSINPGTPQIIAANHSSWYDVLALAACTPKRFRFIAKKELTRIPFFGQAWQAAGHIAIDRSDTQRAIQSLGRAGRIVQEDRSCIIIFPEGTRSASDAMLPLKKGAFMLALHNGIDIVPCGIHGARAILPRNGWRVRPGTIILRFGEPVRTADYGDARRDQLIAKVRSEIEQLRQAGAPVNRDHGCHHQRSRP